MTILHNMSIIKSEVYEVTALLYATQLHFVKRFL
nr:MAG TPA: hypothetical protein [Caudoviricetes sp.]